jgi:bacterial/archaeal transporter family protein
MEMWVVYALISMFFAGLTSILAKYGLQEVSGDIALVVRSTFIVVIVWLNATLFDNVKTLGSLSRSSLLFLGLSAITTSISWIYYYRAIKIGHVSTVALIDKGSVVITLILAYWLLDEPFTLKTFLGAALIVSGVLVLVWK